MRASIFVHCAAWLDQLLPDHLALERVTTRVQCGDYFEVRDRALLAHETQIDPTSRWFFVPLEIQREVWPSEDYELVRSFVDSPTPEDDLFAGFDAGVAVRPAV